jgi:hypothetical protein
LALRIDRSQSRRRTLSLGALAMLSLLLVQFLVGMFVNLYVGIAPSHPGATGSLILGAVIGVAWAIATGGPALAFHTGLGLLLSAGSLALLGIAILAGRRALIVTTSLGLLGVLGAGLNGIGFLNYGIDKATYLMSVGFSVAVAGYVATLFFASLPAVRRLEGAGRQTARG